MSIFTIIDATGEMVQTMSLSDVSQLPANVPAGYGYVDGACPTNSFYAGGAWVAKPAQPAPYSVWDKVNKVWTDPRTLAQVQSQQIATLQAAYQAAINAPVEFKNSAGATSTYPAGDVMSLNGKTAAQNLSNCITPGADAWTMGHWLDANNVAQVFAFADLQGLAAAMEAVEVLDWQDLVAKIAAVQAATTIAAVESITF